MVALLQRWKDEFAAASLTRKARPCPSDARNVHTFRRRARQRSQAALGLPQYTIHPVCRAAGICTFCDDGSVKSGYALAPRAALGGESKTSGQWHLFQASSSTSGSEGCRVVCMGRWSLEL
jgi:hypothetical protein